MNWSDLYFLFFLIPIVLFSILSFIRRKKNRASFIVSRTREFKTHPISFKVLLSKGSFYLKVLALVVAVIALARPQKMDTKIKRNVEGVDIVVALDVSDSMLIEDMKPENRLEASKKTIKEFVEKRVSDRIGLVVFSGESYTRVPMTLDYPMLLKNLSEVTTSKNIKMGTAIGVALANAVGRLKDSTAKSKIVIFLTDGENNSGTIDPETAIEIAKGYGVKIYSIGMGRDGQAQLPVYIESGQGTAVKRYRPIHSKINEVLLNNMADQTGGKFYRAETSNALDSVFNDINKLEKTKIETSQFTRYEELFQKILFFAIFAYWLNFLFAEIWFRRAV